MSTPHYVAKRVGDEYTLVRDDAQECVTSYAAIAGGCLLAMSGVRRRSLPGLALAALGGGLIYRGVTGRSPWQFLSELACAAQPPGMSPSHQHDFKAPTDQAPTDKIEEASMESFPASDPPAHKTSPALGA